MKPAVLHQRNGIQLSYDAPSPIYDCRVYPRESSNGSTVIIYGHESGLRAVWYAGRKFKTVKQSQPKSNGTKKVDEPMVIDLYDDDEPPPPEQPDAKVEFESDEDEVEPSNPYHGVLRHLDIPLGAAVIRLAIPPLSSELSETSNSPSILKEHAIVAVACTDHTIRLIVLPLQPPSPATSHASQTGIQIVRLVGPRGHQDLITSVALTYTGQDDDSSHDEGQSGKLSFLVASTSCTGSGLLLVHQIPIKASRLVPEAENFVPIRRQHLRLPLMSARLSFNTSAHPAERHSTLLISIPDASCVKVYQVFRQYAARRNRRGSASTTESVSSTRSVAGSGVDRGKFLIALLPAFSAANDADINQPRKSILDAKWIANGRAVMALIQGGEWGIWDLEAAGPPSSSNSNLIKGQGSISGIVGGSWTKFAIKGSLPSPASGSHSTNPVPNTSGDLVPATPHTRKVQARGLFQGGINASVPSNIVQSGSISTSTTHDATNDESIIINYGTQNFYIPSILSPWKSEASCKGGFTTSSSNSSILPSLRLGGDQIKSVFLLPHFPKQQDVSFGARTYPNFMAATSNRLVLFVSPLNEPSSQDLPAETTQRMRTSRESTDRSLLQQGVMDVDDMDRILDNMGSSNLSNMLTSTKTTSRVKPNFGKSVVFTQDDDMDITPDVPSPTTTTRLQLSRTKGTERRLFS